MANRDDINAIVFIVNCVNNAVLPNAKAPQIGFPNQLAATSWSGLLCRSLDFGKNPVYFTIRVLVSMILNINKVT